MNHVQTMPLRANQPNPTQILKWLERACGMTGKGAIQIALLVLSQSDSLQRRTCIALTPAMLVDRGLSRMTAYRALRALEGAGLVEVARQRGCNPSVTVFPVYE